MTLLGIVLLVWGFLTGGAGVDRIAAGIVLACLAGTELALREHLAGYRSHSALLSGVVVFGLVTGVVMAVGPVRVWLLALVGSVVFAGSVVLMRELFKRRSGGVGFKA